MPELGRAFVQAEFKLWRDQYGIWRGLRWCARHVVFIQSVSLTTGRHFLYCRNGSACSIGQCDARRTSTLHRTVQGDYNQAVHGGGHGDYNPICLRLLLCRKRLTNGSFLDLAEKYRAICMVILDGCVGQMMEPGANARDATHAAHRLGLGD